MPEVVLCHAGSLLGRGFLTGRSGDPDSLAPDELRRRDPRFAGEHLERNRVLRDAVRRLAAERGVTPGRLALAWLLAQGEDVAAIPGTKRRARVEENAAAAAITLSAAELARLETAAPRHAWAGDRFSFAAHRTERRAV
jgi:aryl-alcohol dehydrogenase-like predicted oxidoreductase